MRLLFLLCAALAGLAVAAPAEAAGSLVRGSLPAVYYVATDAKRYVFPNERTYFSWYPDFGTVRQVSDEQLARYPIGGNVTYRAGTRLLKLQSDPTVYAVEEGGVLRRVQSEADAIARWGAGWAALVDDLPDGFWPAYRVGEPLRADEELAPGAPGDPAQMGSVARQQEDVRLSAVGGNHDVLRDRARQEIASFVLQAKASTRLAAAVVELVAETQADNDKDAGGLLRGDGRNNLTANLLNLRLVDARGLAVAAAADLVIDGQDGKQTLSFEGSRTFAPGRHSLRLIADVPVDAALGERYHATFMSALSTFAVSGVAQPQALPAEADAAAVTVEDPAIKVRLRSGEASVVLRGQAGAVDAAGFDLVNPLLESAFVESFTLTAFVDEGEGDPDFTAGGDEDEGTFTSADLLLEEVSLVRADTGVTLASAASVPSDGKMRFEGIRWEIPAGGTLPLTARARFSPQAPFELGRDRVAFDVGEPEDDVRASDAQGAALDVTGAAPNAGFGAYVTLAEGGTLRVEGTGIAPARFVMGEGEAAYALTFSADESEDMVVDELALRLTDPSAAGSVRALRLEFTDAAGARASRSVAPTGAGIARFAGLGLIVPRDDGSGRREKDVTAYVDVASSAQGAVSGDLVGVSFDPGDFRAHGAVSGVVLTEEDFGHELTDATEVGATAVVRKNVPMVSRPAEQPAATGRDSLTSPLLRFSLRSRGEGGAEVTRLTFKVEATDAGTELNDETADNDLLENLADGYPAGQDANAIVELAELTDGGRVVGEGSDGHISYLLYDPLTRMLDDTPQGLDTVRGSYALIRYDFTFPLLLSSAERLFEFRLDTTGAAALDNPDAKAFLIDGADFRWSDGTFDGADEDGAGVASLPAAGNWYSF